MAAHCRGYNFNWCCAMDDAEVKARILAILDTFGMKDVKAAEIMGIGIPNYKSKKRGLSTINSTLKTLKNLLITSKKKAENCPKN